MQMETNATVVAMLAAQRCLSTEVEQIQMSPSPCFYTMSLSHHQTL